MNRRFFLQLLAQTGALTLLQPFPAGAQGRRHSRPGDSAWPAAAEWEKLRQRVGGRLLQPVSPMQACVTDAGSAAAQEALRNAGNPFFLEDQAGGTQSTGWEHAWTSHPSTYAVAAEEAQDVVEAVHFARRHNVRLVVKGTGHDYLGRSCAPDSLLVWTHRMRDTRSVPNFVPAGAPAGSAGVPAITVGAGTRWLEAYAEATTRGGRYVQGGGCASVGVAGGFTQGGGFGSFSKKFGTGAAGVLQMEVVTADGEIRTVNAYQHPDLFWALRGGGASTFGIVTRMTLATHELPEQFGLLHGTIQAPTDAAFQDLITRFCAFYRDHLNNEHWGEQFAFNPDNSLSLYLTFQGLDRAAVEKLWAEWLPLGQVEIVTIPAREMWNLAYYQQHHPQLVQLDPRDGVHFWWASNSAEVSKYWYTYQSRWIPLSAFADPAFPETVFQASRFWPVSMHINKGLSGASADALERGRQTSVNPVVYKAAALAILAAGKRGVFPGIPGLEPDLNDARSKIQRIDAAMALLRASTPTSGSYVNEADYFEKNWQSEFWGIHYPRLLEIKRRYDPTGLFHCHHSVGSELASRA